MGTLPTGRIAVMSIFPEFAEKILNGSKRIEFRKRRFADDVNFVLMYATCPVAKVVGYFVVSGYDEAPPESLWEIHQGHAGIDYPRFMRYYDGVENAVGIKFSKVQRLEEPLDLNQISNFAKPPQSFLYLEVDARIENTLVAVH